MKYLIANWKANKTVEDVKEWVSIFKNNVPKDLNETSIILAASAPHLSLINKELDGLPSVFCASQSVSNESGGSFTGEITARALKGIVSFCIVGHSERRERGETNDAILNQIKNLKEVGITPILCIRTVDDLPSDYSGIVAYEQPEAIGTGINTDVNEVMSVYNKLNLSQDSIFLYGASVDENNCREYLSHPEIRGFMVGTASLDPLQFIKILKQI